MNTLLFILVFIIWIIYNSIEGFREAHYYNVATKLDLVEELHPIFLVQRFLVFILINVILIYLDWKLLIYDLALILIQPFFHNGMYYFIRNKLNNKIYPKKWLDQSNTSTAFLTKFETANFRIIYAIIAILLIILICFI